MNTKTSLGLVLSLAGAPLSAGDVQLSGHLGLRSLLGKVEGKYERSRDKEEKSFDVSKQSFIGGIGFGYKENLEDLFWQVDLMGTFGSGALKKSSDCKYLPDAKVEYLVKKGSSFGLIFGIGLPFPETVSPVLLLGPELSVWTSEVTVENAKEKDSEKKSYTKVGLVVGLGMDISVDSDCTVRFRYTANMGGKGSDVALKDKFSQLGQSVKSAIEHRVAVDLFVAL